MRNMSKQSPLTYDRPFQKSLINQLPESVDFTQKLKQQSLQIQRLHHALQFYRNNQSSNSMQTSKQFEQYIYQIQIKELIQKAGVLQMYRKQNYQFKEYVKQLEEQVLQLKASQAKGTNLQKQYAFVLLQINRLKYQNNQIQNQLTKLTFENTEFKKAINSLTQLTQEQHSTSQLGNHSKSINYSDEQNNKKLVASLQSKIKDLQKQLQLKQTKILQANSKNFSMQKKVNELIQQKTQYLQNQFFRFDPPKNVHRSVTNSFSQKKHNNSISQFQVIDYDRLQLKVVEKNKQYELLYSKYLFLQNDKIALEQLNSDLQKQRRFLADRLSDLQILTQGDQVAGQLQNKLVLMSTQLMRLGTLNRTKTQESKQFSFKLKQALHKKQTLQKQLLQKQKIILNYKEQLTMLQIKLQSKDFLNQQDSASITQLKQTLFSTQKQKERYRYLFRQKQEDFKTIQLKCKVYEQKISRIQMQSKQLQKQNRQHQKSLMSHSNNKFFNLELEVDKLKNHNLTLTEEIKHLQQKIVKLRSQLHTQQLQNQTLLSDKQNVQSKLNSLKQVYKKHQMRFEDQQNQINSIKHKYEEKLILKIQQIRKLQEKIITLQNKSPIKSASKMDTTNVENLYRFEQQNMILRIDLKNYQEKVVMLSQQVQRLNFLLQKVNHEVSDLQLNKTLMSEKDKQIRQNRKKLENLTNSSKRSLSEVQNLKLRIKQLSQQLKQYHKFQGESRRFKHQIQVLTSQLQIKKQELQRVKSRNNIPLSPRSMESQLQSKLSLYQRKLQSLPRQIQQKYRQKLQNYENRLNEYEEGHSQLETQVQQSQQLSYKLSNEVRRLNEVLGDRIHDIVKLQKQLELSNHKVQKCEQMLSKRQISSKIIIQSTSQIQQSTHHSRQNQKQIVLLKERLDSFKQSNGQLQTKLDLFTAQKIKLEHKLSQIQYMNGEKSRVNRDKQGVFQMTITQIKVKNQRLQNSMKQIESYYIQKLQHKQKQLDKKHVQNRQMESTMHDLQIKLNVQTTKLMEQLSFYENNQQHHRNQSIFHKSQNQLSKKVKQQYQMKLALLSQQIQRYQALMKQRKGQIKQIKQKLETQQQKNKKMIVQHQCTANTIQLLSGQIQRLSGVLANTFQQIRGLQKEIYKKQVTIEQFKLHSAPRKSNTSQQFKWFEQKQYKLKQEYQQKLHLLSKDLESIKSKYNSLQKENYQSKYELQAKITKLTTIQRELSIKQSQKRQVQQQKQQLQDKFNRLKLNINSEAQNNSNYKGIYQQIKILRESNHTLESKLILILQQNKQLVHQVQSFKRSKSNSISNGNNYATSKQMQMPLMKANHQIQKYQQHISIFKEQNQNLMRQKQGLNRQILRLQQQIQNNSKLRPILREKQEKSEDLQIKNKKLARDKQILADQISKLQDQFNKKVDQCRNLSKKLNEVQYQSSLHLNKIDILNRQVQRLNINQRQTKSPLQEESSNKYWKQNFKYKEEIIKCKNQIAVVRQQLQNKNYHIRKLQKIVNQYQSQSPKKPSKDYFSSDKKEKLPIIKQANQAEQRSRTPSVQNNINPTLDKKSEHQFDELSKKYQLLQGLNRKLKNECDCYRKKNIEYEFKLNKLKQQFELVSKLIQQYRNENQRLKNTVRRNINSPVRDRQVMQTTHSQHKDNFNSVKSAKTNNFQYHEKKMDSQNLNSRQNSFINIRQHSFTSQRANFEKINSVFKNQTGLNQNQNIIQHIPMLMTEIDRLSSQNKTYLHQINDLKVQILNFDSRASRHQENLAVMVLLMAQVQNLRMRLKQTENQRQKIRKQNIVSPIKNRI